MYVLPSALPECRTPISACQHVSSANNKLFARTQHLPSPSSPFLQQSTLLAKHAQQILGQVENKTLGTSSPALHLWPQNWALGAHTTGFSTLASPSPALGCKAGQGVLTPAWLPAAAFPELGRSGRLAGRCYPTPAWFLLPFQAGRPRELFEPSRASKHLGPVLRNLRLVEAVRGRGRGGRAGLGRPLGSVWESWCYVQLWHLTSFVLREGSELSALLGEEQPRSSAISTPRCAPLNLDFAGSSLCLRIQVGKLYRISKQT